MVNAGSGTAKTGRDRPPAHAGRQAVVRSGATEDRRSRPA